MKRKDNERADSRGSKRNATKFGNFIATKRKRNLVADVESTDNTATSNDERIVDIVTNDTFDADNGIITEVSESGSGSGNDSGRDGSGSGRDGRTGSDRNRSDSTGNSGKRGRRSRATIIEDYARELDVPLEEAQRIYESQRAPRKVKASEVVSDGVTGSVLLLSTIFEGGADLLAMASGKPYLELQKAESKELSEAVIDLIESWPSSVRKRFDKMMKLYIPYWKLAKALTMIAYPRYQIFQMEKQANARPNNQNKTESINKAKAGNADSEQPTSANSESWPDNSLGQNFG